MWRQTEPAEPPTITSLGQFFGVFRYSGRAIALVWMTHPRITVALALSTLAAGVLPAGIAWVGKLLIDAVVAAARSGEGESRALALLALEGVLVMAMAGIQRGLAVCESLLRALLGQRVHVLILEKALGLEMRHFEDSEFYDRLTQARREATTRPLSLVKRTFGLLQNGIALFTYSGLLLRFSGWTVVALLLAGLPVFFAETRFSGEAFRLFRWKSPERRRQSYLEMVLSREDFAKEVQLFGLGPLLLDRYRAIFDQVYPEDRRLTLRRGGWGFALEIVNTATLYGVFAWIVLSAARGAISLGEMTLYLLVFKQGQSAFSSILASIGGMYEDNLYVSTLYDFLGEPTPDAGGSELAGPEPGDGLRFEAVHFTYPGAEEAALQGVSFHLRPGRKLALVGENGSGKTTLVKLITRLYRPDHGRILLDGRQLSDWDLGALRRRIGVIFQDFVRYQLTAGENIGVGDVDAFDDRQRRRRAAHKGMALPFLEALAEGLETQLGRWFGGGRELSGGQWQRVALSRALMREKAQLLILDEPTAAMDAASEAQIFDRFRAMLGHQMAILVSHRFSTVRMADRILVLERGRVVEEGSHDQLMALGGRYQRLFSLQAAGYR